MVHDEDWQEIQRQRTECARISLNIVASVPLDALHDIGRPAGLRSSIVLDSVVLAFELHSAIANLVATDHLSAAHALMRGHIETTLRSLWAAYVAQFELIEGIASNKYTPDIDKLIKALGKAKGFSQANALARELKPLAPQFHSYAHMSIMQLVRREQGFSVADAAQCCRLADSLVLIAAQVASAYFHCSRLNAFAVEKIQIVIDDIAHWQGRAPPPRNMPLPQPPPVPHWTDPR